MANTKSAGKRARQTLVRTSRNRSVLTRLRKMQKKTTESGAQQDDKSVRALVSAVDKAAKRGIIHRNAANRRKARLNRGRVGKPTPADASAAKPSTTADAS